MKLTEITIHAIELTPEEEGEVWERYWEKTIGGRKIVHWITSDGNNELRLEGEDFYRQVIINRNTATPPIMNTKDKLIYFLKKYGNDFFHKLPSYKTAYHENECVGLIKFYPETLTFDITWKASVDGVKTVNIFELDDFVL